MVLTGAVDPTYGWSHNLYVVTEAMDSVRSRLNHKYLNDVEGLSVPTLENVAIWLWRELSRSLAGVARVEVSRGAEGHGEGCIYRGPETLSRTS